MANLTDWFRSSYVFSSQIGTVAGVCLDDKGHATGL